MDAAQFTALHAASTRLATTQTAALNATTDAVTAEAAATNAAVANLAVSANVTAANAHATQARVAAFMANIEVEAATAAVNALMIKPQQSEHQYKESSQSRCTRNRSPPKSQQQQPQRQKQTHQTSQPGPLATNAASKSAQPAIIAQPETRRAGNAMPWDTSKPSATPNPKWQPSTSIKCPPPKTTASQFQSRPEENQPQRYVHYQTLAQPSTPSHRLSTTANFKTYHSTPSYTSKPQPATTSSHSGPSKPKSTGKPTTDRPDPFSQPSMSWKTRDNQSYQRQRSRNWE
ncbi:hypothetical protein DAPPUDRAFT_109562 [Daphnia pulex]|uniref:Uncharacterized protein n=1 Tax=Daphnia pulex TaxID=6669 RepID=E9H3G3_DAPPU|nr:hypothetical protein DAPPUDRAFT_109562 [Daphnia pulex]|eukprot:EFX73765.1 hypothetical protein DAPPUDRAFT_109562 [Daphnia pulex]